MRNWAFLSTLALLIGSTLSVYAAEPLPRIGVRPGSPSAQFYNVETGARFTPDGFSYTIIDQIASRETYPYQPTYAHVTFDTGFYNAAAMDEMLGGVAGNGFNVVRVIFDSGDSVHQGRGVYGVAGPADSTGLYQPVVANLVDFLRRARSHRVYVILTLHAFPENRGFRSIVTSGAMPHVTGTSQYYFARGGIRAKAEYARELVGDVASVDGGSLLSTVLAWSLEVEQFVSDESEPFSLHSGSVTTADGKTYDMGDPAARQACMDSNMINWATQVSAAIHSQDAKALVTAGFTTYASVHKPGPNGLIRTPGSDQRYPPRLVTFMRTRALSFIDLHAYPRNRPGYALAHDLDSIEFAQWNMQSVPVILGEYGASKRQFPDLQTASAAARRQQEEAFRLGMSGTVYWTWNTIHGDWWSAIESGGGVLHSLVRPQ